MFIGSSVLFSLTAVLIYYRKFVRKQLEPFCRTPPPETMFIHSLRAEIRGKSRLGNEKPPEQR